MLTTRWPGAAPARDWSSRVRVRGAMLLMAWVEFLGHIPWTLFVTLTFDPKRGFPVGRQRASREALTWCGHVGWTLRRPVAWLIAPERGASGLWHVHVLLVGVPHDISALAKMWELRNGRIDVRPVTSTAGIVLYSTKQAAHSGEVLLSDTLAEYRNRLSGETRVRLYPDAPELPRCAAAAAKTGPAGRLPGRRADEDRRGC